MRTLFRGFSACAGTAVGSAVVISRGRAVRKTPAGDIAAEHQRLAEAMEGARAELTNARAELAGHDAELVLNVHLMMHGDDLLARAIKRRIDDEGVSADWALRAAVDELKSPLLASSASYFRERAEDIEHVGQHILRHLRGETLTLPNGGNVLVTHELSPADAVQLLSTGNVEGLVTATGSARSHTAILARAFDVPTVVGARGIVSAVRDAERLIVDGTNARVIVGPTAREADEVAARGARYRAYRSSLVSEGGDAVSVDGVEVTLRANVELPREASRAVRCGARGIGLLRSEFLYLDADEPPSEDAQVAAYREAARAVGDVVVVRTFDLGGDKLPSGHRLGHSRNPALGLRAIRLTMWRGSLMRTQLRAVLRAAHQHEIRVLFPLVSTVSELRAVKVLLEECRAELRDREEPFGDVAVGAMIEVPSAALQVCAISEEVDFLAVGTNDLIQYTLAVDRSDPRLAHLADPLSPAILSLLHSIRVAAETSGRPVSICGDVATHPLALPLALGLGYREFSVPPSALVFVRECIRRVEVKQLAEMATEALTLRTAAEVKALIDATVGDALRTLWTEQGIADPVSPI